MRALPILLAMAVSLIADRAAAQLGLPGVGLPPVELPGQPLERTLRSVAETADRAAERLLRLRMDRFDRLLRRNREAC